MTRLPRRAALLVAFSLLTSAATAYADCAWALSSNFLASDDGPKLDDRDVEDSIESEPIPLDSEGLPYGSYLRRVSQMIRAWMRYPCVKDETGRCEYKSANLVVVFSLFEDGRVANVQVQEPSGYAIYDEYAVNAIKSAAPFPPVPPELMARAKPGSPSVRFGVRFRIFEGTQSGAIPIDSPHPKYTDYLRQVRQRIQTNLESPCVLEGVACKYKATEVTVEFGIGKDGRLDFARVVSPSTWPIYDEYSVRAIRLASPFSGVPDSISHDAGFSVRTTFQFFTGRPPELRGDIYYYLPDTVDPRGVKGGAR